MFNNQELEGIHKINDEQINEKLARWPDSYYEEKEGINRKALLEEAMKRDLPVYEENLFRKELFDRRYEEANDPEIDTLYYDMFMRAYFELKQIALRGTFSSKKTALRDVKRSLTKIGYLDAEGNIPKYKDILTAEIKHMAMYYIDISLNDKKYTSLIWGFGTLKKSEVYKKIAREFYEATDLLTNRLKIDDLMSVWNDGIFLGFKESIPNWSSILEQIRKEL